MCAASNGDVSSSTLDRVCLLSGSLVHIITMNVDTGDNTSTVVNVGANAEVATWTPDASCVVVGDSGGRLHFVSAAGTLLFSKAVFDAGHRLEDTAPVFSRLSFSSPPAIVDGSDELFVGSSFGTVLRLSGIRIVQLRDAAAAGDVALLKSFRSSMEVSTLAISDHFGAGVTCQAVTWQMGGSLVAAAGNGDLAVGVWVSAPDAMPGISPLRLCSVLPVTTLGGAARLVAFDGSQHARLFVVSDANVLSAWKVGSTPDTPTEAALLGEAADLGVDCFTVMPRPMESTAAEHVAWLCATLLDGSTAVLRVGFEVAGAASFTVESRFEGSATATAAPHSELRQAFVLQQADESGAPSLLQAIRPQVAVSRLEGLVAAGDLEAATAWATEHDIDHSDVMRAQASVMSRDIGASTGDEEPAAVARLARHLEALVAATGDVAFATEVCLGTHATSSDNTFKLLRYALSVCEAALQRLGIQDDDNEAGNGDDGHDDGDTSDEKIMVRDAHAGACDALRRWSTYGLLQEEYTPQTWHRFRCANVVDVLRGLLRAGRIRGAATVWGRHASPDTAAQVVPLLGLIKPDAPVGAYVPWVRDGLVPHLSPPALLALSEWADGQARAVERLDASPGNALLVATVLAASPGSPSVGRPASCRPPADLNTSTVSLGAVMVDAAPTLGALEDATGGNTLDCLRSPKQLVADALARSGAGVVMHVEDATDAASHTSDGCTPLAVGLAPGLPRLCALLQEQAHLSAAHGLHLPLDELEVETVEGVAVAMLDRCTSPGDVPGGVGDHVAPYCASHGVDVDGLLVSHVAELCEAMGADGGVDQTNDHLQQRCMVLVRCVTDARVRVDAAMLLLQAASPPYSDDMHALMADTLTWPTSRQDEVREQQRLMQLYGVLSRHTARDFNLADDTHALMLLHHVAAQVHREDALEDAFTLAAAYSHIHRHLAHALCLENLAVAPPLAAEVPVGAAQGAQGIVGPLAASVAAARCHHVVRWLQHASVSEADQLAVGQELVQFCVDTVEAAVLEDLDGAGSAADGFAAMEAALGAGASGSPGVELPPGAAAFWQAYSMTAVAEAVLDCVLRLRTAARIQAEAAAAEALARPLESAPAHPQLHVATAALADQIRVLHRLQAEFGLFLDLGSLASGPLCEDLLRGAIRPMLGEVAPPTLAATAADDDGVDTLDSIFAGEDGGAPEPAPVPVGEPPQVAPTALAHVFRFSELLGVPRDALRAALAKESASAGDVLGTLKWCRDLTSQAAAADGPAPTSATTAGALREVATLLAAYTVAHPDVFNVRTHSASPVAKSRARAHEHAERLLRQSLVMCPEAELALTATLWRGADLVTQVLAKSEVGEYGRLWEGDHPSDAGGADADGGGFGRDVYTDWFRETCMVLKTSRAMTLTSRFVVVAQVHRQCVQRLGGAPPTDAPPSDIATLLAPSAFAGPPAAVPAAPATDAVPSWLSPGGLQALTPAATGDRLVSALDALVDYLVDAGAIQLAAHALMFASPDVLRDAHAQRVEALFRRLVAKVLASKAIDASLAQCYLLSMPERLAFDTFRAALPGLLGDFVRLGAVGVVGVSTARAWGQELFFEECQALRTNAQWWHKLATLGIAVDTKLFRQQGSDYPRSFVSQLLERTKFDLDVALEYCDSYDIEREYAVLMYVEYLLVHPAAADDVNYQTKVALAAAQAPTGALQHVLTNTLPRVRATDYERIHFVYTLLRRLDAPNDDDLRRHLSALEILQSFTALEVTAAVAAAAPEASVRTPGTVSTAPRRTVAGGVEPAAVDEVEAARLPFHLLVEDPWAVLTPQLTPESVPKLLGLCGPLALDADEFYVHLVKRLTLAIVAREAALPTPPPDAAVDARSGPATPASSKAAASPTREPPPPAHAVDPFAGRSLCFADVRPQLLCVRSAQLAVEVAEWCVRQLPLGPAKQDALELGVQLANAWKAALDDAAALAETSKPREGGARRVVARPTRRLGLPTDGGTSSDEDDHGDGREAAAAVVERMTAELRRVATHLQLRGLGAEYEAFACFLDSPAELICELLHRKAPEAARVAFAHRAGATLRLSPGVDGTELHVVVRDIARRHGVNLFRIKKLLVQRWIRAAEGDGGGAPPGSTGDTPGGDATESEAEVVFKSPERGVEPVAAPPVPCLFEPSPEETRRVHEEENELRVVYVLASLPAEAAEGAAVSDTTPSAGAAALVEMAFAKNATKPSFRARARALACAFRLLPASSVEALSGRSLATLADYWQLCLHMAEFELLRIPQSLQTLQACSKPALVRGLWRDHRDNPRAVRLIATLMLDFRVNDVNLWVAVLGSLAGSDQHRAALTVLSALCDAEWCGMLRFSKKFAALFEAAAFKPFEELGGGGGTRYGDHPGVATIMSQVVSLVQRCPVLHMIDVAKFVTAFMELGPTYAGHAIRVALVGPGVELRGRAVQGALSQAAHAAAVGELCDGAAGVGADGGDTNAVLLGTALEAIDGEDAHEVLVGTPMMKVLTQYLIRVGRIDRLLRFTITTDNVVDGVGLVAAYYAAHPEDAPAEGGDGFEAVRHFVGRSEVLKAGREALLRVVDAAERAVGVC